MKGENLNLFVSSFNKKFFSPIQKPYLRDLVLLNKIKKLTNGKKE